MELKYQSIHKLSIPLETLLSTAILQDPSRTCEEGRHQDI